MFYVKKHYTETIFHSAKPTSVSLIQFNVHMLEAKENSTIVFAQQKCQLTFLYVRQLQNLMTYFRAPCDQMPTSETHGGCVGKNRGSAKNPRIMGVGKFMA